MIDYTADVEEVKRICREQGVSVMEYCSIVSVVSSNDRNSLIGVAAASIDKTLASILSRLDALDSRLNERNSLLDEK
jgi:hypothetical protein